MRAFQNLEDFCLFYRRLATPPPSRSFCCPLLDVRVLNAAENVSAQHSAVLSYPKVTLITSAVYLDGLRATDRVCIEWTSVRFQNLI